ncbi:iron chelate uptake ABC transporter family permease subunit [Corynebacterium sp. MSK297]|uniref:ABC transporter permease n=1 Tax=Corynebacterium sp. MSK297 TaxID=3050221 RepID=UPI00254DBBC8|nr:iron chelate uptake ABC transporter family permease subunit [Corynebacterium sp. MSK297]MDK8846554.1 iron chelate uptake ABC transporter family permease subunit [Corynebacterium sp. MSK297]
MKLLHRWWAMPLAIGILVALAGASIMIGAADFDWELLRQSRLPRTAAVLLAGSALAMAGLLMQLLTQNRFVEPSTVGTTESAALGLLLITIFAPASPIFVKMAVACAAAIAGTALFIFTIGRLRHRKGFIVPLVGIMIGTVIGAISTFIALDVDLIQSLNAWQLGSFAGAIVGRWELLMLVAVMLVISYFVADRFTLLGLGKSYAINAGINFKRTETLGLVIVAITAAIVVTVIGSLPFLGLVVPNIVSLYFGDNARRSLPWVMILGAGFTLICDLAGRLLRYPFEIPVGTVVGVVGGAIFLVILLRRHQHAH